MDNDYTDIIYKIVNEEDADLYIRAIKEVEKENPNWQFSEIKKDKLPGKKIRVEVKVYRKIKKLIP